MNSNDETIDGSDSARNPLEVLAAEFSEARRAGLQPSIDEYVQRVPNQREEARALLESLALFERVSEEGYTQHIAHKRAKRFERQQPEQLGDFRIVREIGRGGMGIIYEAEQITLKRRVALKVLSSTTSESAKQLERFQREAEAVARLHHTNIVPVFGSGSQDGVHYFAMQLIDGEPLSKLPELSFVNIGRVGMQAASALSYAHGHGVLHRDVKPSNLLLDKGGEVWVTDFGLAKLSDVGELTQTGDIMGTFKYMAPEQLEGRADERTDIYSLGLTLYELATRQPAFDISKSLANRIRNHEFPTPRSVNAEIPRDLETIILKATASEPRHRYATASDLAEDLRCFMEDRPIAARRTSSIERLRRWMRRNPALAASLVATLLLMATTTVVSAWGYATTHAALTTAKRARDEAFEASKEADLARQQADSARQQAVASQGRAESNLNVALQAFDAIFDNVAQRGVPQSLTQDMQQAAGAEGDNTSEATANTTRDSSQFEATLSSADAELLNNLLKFYSKFADQNGEDAALQVRTAQAYHRIGQIQLRLGKSEEALASYRAALDLLWKIHQQRPDDVPVVLLIARVYNDGGLAVSTVSRDVREIVDFHKAASGLLESQSQEVKQQPDTRFELARAYDLAGSILGRSGASSLEDMLRPTLRFGFDGPRPNKFDGERGPNPDVLSQRNPNKVDRPGDRFRDFFKSDRLFRNGPPDMRPPGFPPDGPPPDGPPPDSFSPDGPPPEGMADGHGPEGSGQRPRGKDWRSTLEGWIGRGPMAALERGGPRAGIQARIDEDLIRGRDLLAGLCAEYPHRYDYLLAYATAERHLLMHFVATDRMPEALQAFDKAREALNKLKESAPNDPKVLLELADSLSTASARLVGLDPEQSEEYLRQSAQLCYKLCESFPSVAEYQALLATCEDKLGMLEQSKQHWQPAEDAYQLAIVRLLKLKERFPNDRFYQLSLLQSVTHLAELRMIPDANLSSAIEMKKARELLIAALEPCKSGGVSKSAIERAERALRAFKGR